jgi:hypothetical protein
VGHQRTAVRRTIAQPATHECDGGQRGQLGSFTRPPSSELTISVVAEGELLRTCGRAPPNGSWVASGAPSKASSSNTPSAKPGPAQGRRSEDAFHMLPIVRLTLTGTKAEPA